MAARGSGIHALDLLRSMVWGTSGDTSWAWVLEPLGDGTTRLITRIRSRYRWLSPSIAFSDTQIPRRNSRASFDAIAGSRVIPPRHEESYASAVGLATA
jgi:hypothetical protein